MRGPVSAVGRLYGPAGEYTREFYGCGRGFTGEPSGGLTRRGEYGPGGELGGLDGRGRELYKPVRGLGGPARGRVLIGRRTNGGGLSRGLVRGGELGRELYGLAG